MDKELLDVNDYFKTDKFHKDGFYKIIAKNGNFFFVKSKSHFKDTCHGMCPCMFEEHAAKCKTKERKDNVYTCMFIPPGALWVKKIPKLTGLLEFGE